MRYSYFALLTFCVLFLTVSGETGLVKRGTARMMSFGDDNSQLLSKRNRGTWYSGKDLKDAACYGREGLPPFSAHVGDMIGAMKMEHFEYCYKCMKITNRDNKHCITVKIVDKCAACAEGTAIDLTPGAFKKLNPDLDDGVLNITWEVVRCTEDFLNLF